MRNYLSENQHKRCPVLPKRKQLADTVDAAINSHVVGPVVKVRIPRTAPSLRGNLDALDAQRKKVDGVVTRERSRNEHKASSDVAAEADQMANLLGGV